MNSLGKFLILGISITDLIAGTIMLPNLLREIRPCIYPDHYFGCSTYSILGWIGICGVFLAPAIILLIIWNKERKITSESL